MALVLGVLDNYVVEGYIEDQNLYVLGPAASVVTISVTGENYRFVEGAVTSEASFAWSATADPSVYGQATMDAVATVSVAGTTQNFVEGSATADSATSASITATQVFGGTIAATSTATEAIIDVGLAIAYGNATVSTTEYKFAPASIRIANTSTSTTFGLRVAKTRMPAYGTGDMTLEGWFQAADVSWSQTIFDLRDAGFSDSTGGYTAYVLNNNTLVFQRGNTALHTTAALTPGTWYHWAMVRSSGTINFYLGGTRRYTGTDVSNWPAKPVYLGTNRALNAGLDGYLDEIRQSSVARYSGTTLTEPTAAFADDSDTDLLLHGGSVTTADAPIDLFGLLMTTPVTATATASCTGTSVLTLAGDLAVTVTATQSATADGITHLAQIDSTSTTTTDITGTRQVFGDMAVSSESSQQTTAQIEQSAQAELPGALTFVTEINGVLAAESIWMVQAQIVTQAENLIAGQASMQAEGTVVIGTENIKPFEVTTTATATQTTAAQPTLTTPIALSAQVSQSTDALVTRVQEAAAVFAAENSQSTLGNQIHTLGENFENYDWTTPPSWDNWPNERWGFTGQKVFAAVVTQTTDAGIVFDIQSTVTATFAVSVNAVNTKPAQATLETTATITPVAQVTHSAQAMTWSSAFVQNIGGEGILEASLTVDTTTTTTVVPDLTLGGTITMPDAFDFDAVFGASLVGEIIVPVTATFQAFALVIHSAITDTMAAEFTQSTTVGIIRDQTLGVQFDALATGTGTAQVLHTTPAQFAATAAQSTFAAVQNSPLDIEWSAFNSTLIIGQEMQTDPYRQIEVACENRTLCVLRETRVLEVPCENRINQVAQPPWNEELFRRVA